MQTLTKNKYLHITNDINLAHNLEKLEISGDTLPWQDALYEGPAIAIDDIDIFSKKRACYFADRGYGDYKEIESGYLERNARLKNFKKYTQIILWLDHDLFGQLQFLQLVNWLAKETTGDIEVSIVNCGLFKKGRQIKRLNELTDQQLLMLFQRATELTLSQAETCERGWKAFTASTPHELLKFFPRDMSTTPFLKNAIVRLVQQFPSKLNGLSRTEYLILDALAKQKHTEIEIFDYVQQKEAVPFMSYSIFNQYLEILKAAPMPLVNKKVFSQEVVIEAMDDEENFEEVIIENSYKLELSSLARQVLNNWVDWVQLNGIDRWVGGVHLNDGVIWRYDKNARSLARTYV